LLCRVQVRPGGFRAGRRVADELTSSRAVIVGLVTAVITFALAATIVAIDLLS